MLALLLLSCLMAAVGWSQSQPVCLCATDNRGSFRAVLTAPNDPFKYPPLVENLNPSSFQDFHEAWLPDGYRQIFRSYVFGPSGF